MRPHQAAGNLRNTARRCWAVSRIGRPGITEKRPSRIQEAFSQFLSITAQPSKTQTDSTATRTVVAQGPLRPSPTSYSTS